MQAEDGAMWNVGVRTNNGVNIDCLPTREGPSIGVVLYKPGAEQASGMGHESRQDFCRKPTVSISIAGPSIHEL